MTRTVPVTLWTTCWGTYQSYLPRWLDAVFAMDPLPEEVVIAMRGTDCVDMQVLNGAHRRAEEAGMVVDVLFVLDPPGRWPVPFYNNAAVRLAAHEWVWRCDVDDLMHPRAFEVFANARHYRDDAFRPFDAPGTVLSTIDILVGGNQIWRPDRVDPAYVVAAEFNALVSSSGFRKSAWAEVGGYPDIAYDDWGLWRLLARRALDKGQMIMPVGTTYLYTVHADSVSNNVDAAAARQEVLAL